MRVAAIAVQAKLNRGRPNKKVTRYAFGAGEWGERPLFSQFEKRLRDGVSQHDTLDVST